MSSLPSTGGVPDLAESSEFLRASGFRLPASCRRQRSSGSRTKVPRLPASISRSQRSQSSIAISPTSLMPPTAR